MVISFRKPTKVAVAIPFRDPTLAGEKVGKAPIKKGERGEVRQARISAMWTSLGTGVAKRDLEIAAEKKRLAEEANKESASAQSTKNQKYNI